MSKLSRAVKYIIAIWLLALCLAIPQAMSVGLVYGPRADGGTDSTVCVCGVVETPLVPRAFELSSLICFLAPMLLISVLYALIAAQLHRARITGDNGNESGGHTMNNRSTSVRLQCNPNKSSFGKTIVILEPSSGRGGGAPGGPGGSTGAAGAFIPRVASYGGRSLSGSGRRKRTPGGVRNAQQKATRHVVRMLVAVVAGFFVCWAPFHAQRLLAIYYDVSSGPTVVAIYKILTYVSGVLYYASTCVNPLLYNIMSNKFREAFKVTLARCCHTGRASSVPRIRRAHSVREPRSEVLRGHSSTILRANSSSALRNRDMRRNLSDGYCSESLHSPKMCSRSPQERRQIQIPSEDVTTAVKVTTTAVRPLVVTFRSNCRRRHLVVETPCNCQEHLGRSSIDENSCDIDRQSSEDIESLYRQLPKQSCCLTKRHHCCLIENNSPPPPPPPDVVSSGVSSGKRKRRYTSSADDDKGNRARKWQTVDSNKFDTQETTNSYSHTMYKKQETFHLKLQKPNSWYSLKSTKRIIRSRSCPGFLKECG